MPKPQWRDLKPLKPVEWPWRGDAHPQRLQIPDAFKRRKESWPLAVVVVVVAIVLLLLLVLLLVLVGVGVGIGVVVFVCKMLKSSKTT